jgi:hypothetical protein
MKSENHKDHELPDTARRAFAEYPQITASPDFNRRVLERVLAPQAPARLELFCDRLDAIFARPVLKLLGAACLGAMLALLGTHALLAACGLSTPATQDTAPSRPGISRSLPEAAFADSLLMQNRFAWARQLGEPFVAPQEYSVPRTNDAGERSSSCLAASRSLV